jgi:hypothetical protein
MTKTTLQENYMAGLALIYCIDIGLIADLTARCNGNTSYALLADLNHPKMIAIRISGDSHDRHGQSVDKTDVAYIDSLSQILDKQFLAPQRPLTL